MYNVTFQIESAAPVTVSANAGDNLLETARLANVAIDAPCSGNGSCGKCRVKLLEGELETLPSNHISAAEYADGWRLSCCSRIVSDVTVLVPDIASAYRSRMKTADLSTGQEMAVFTALLEQIRQAGIGFDNAYTVLDVALDAPTLDDTMPDNERLERAVCQMTGCARCEITYYALKRLPGVLRQSGFRVRLLGKCQADRFTVYDVHPADSPAVLCAAAVDIGTTTVSAVLADLKTGRLLAKASAGNGQIRYGADVINRIIQQSRPGGVEKLQDAIVTETLQPLFRLLCREAGVEPGQILRLSIAGNTTMNHLLLGLDAEPVRLEPYIPGFFRYDSLHARDLALPVHPDAPVLLAPNVGSYVGGDITAGAFAGLLWDRDEFTLLIDLGTNGELVLGNRDFLMTCACSAGPAFEGGDISCGMRATDGAVEAVTLDKDSLLPTLSVIGPAGQKPVGLCGSGIIDLIAELFRTGAIDPKGRFVRQSPRIIRDRHGMGSFLLADAGESETGRPITLTEVDIESFIRAKGAIYSAIDTMLAALEFDVSMIDQVLVAGGIGSGINMENAVRIGMFPDVEREKFRYIGNSALSGAYAMALSDAAAEKVAAVAANMTYMELSTHPGYMDNFVAACFLPHTNRDLFPTAFSE